MEIKIKSRETTKTKDYIIEYLITYNEQTFFIIETTNINKSLKINKRYDIYDSDFKEITYSEFGKYLKEQFLMEI